MEYKQCLDEGKDARAYKALFDAAAAFGTDDLETAIRAGLARIPEKSRFHEAIAGTVDRFNSGEPCRDFFAWVHSRWNENDWYDWTHVISNAVIVAASLLYGKKDYARSVGLAVQTGFDTDCSGATVGSVLGVLPGYGALPRSFTDRVCDTLKTGLTSFSSVSVSGMAEKTLQFIEN